MFLYLIRHGEPDYVTDTLTETGKKQAAAVAERMALSKPELLFTSPMGRARETADFTSKKLGLDVKVLPWAYELSDDCTTDFPDGVKKFISRVPPEYLVTDENYRFTPKEIISKLPVFRNEEFQRRYIEISRGTDEFMASLGYEKNADGNFDFKKHICNSAVLFCHCAMMRIVLAELTKMPYHYIASTFMSSFTGVTVLDFYERQNELPRLLSYGDIGHLTPYGLRPINYHTNMEF